MFYLGKATFPISRENQWFCFFTHKQAFASGVRCTCTNPTCGVQVTATALARYREDDSEKSEMCWYKRNFLNFFFFRQNRRAFSDALLLCLFGGERQDSAVRPFLASSPLPIVKVDVSKISNRLPDYPTLKNNSHEAWKCSVTRKKYFERPHTAVFGRSGWEQHPVPWQDDSFGAKHHRLLLWSVRGHHIRVVQRSALVSTDKLWLSRLSFFGMDYRPYTLPKRHFLPQWPPGKHYSSKNLILYFIYSKHSRGHT